MRLSGSSNSIIDGWILGQNEVLVGAWFLEDFSFKGRSDGGSNIDVLKGHPLDAVNLRKI